MDSVSLEFFSPVLDGVDRWTELITLLPVLVLLELILSADNAVALASIARRLRDPDLQRKSLNIGILISLLFRIGLILTANIIIKYSFIQIIASIYLLYIVINKFFLDKIFTKTDNKEEVDNSSRYTFLRITLLLALTDLAFSIDSVTAAVAISDQILLVLIGAFIGVIALRFTANLFIDWLDIYVNLEVAGYLAITLVALKLLIEVLLTGYVIPDYVFYILLALTFVWGFSSKK